MENVALKDLFCTHQVKWTSVLQYTNFLWLNSCLKGLLSHFLSEEWLLNRATAVVRWWFDRLNAGDGARFFTVSSWVPVDHQGLPQGYKGLIVISLCHLCKYGTGLNYQTAPSAIKYQIYHLLDCLSVTDCFIGKREEKIHNKHTCCFKNSWYCTCSVFCWRFWKMRKNTVQDICKLWCHEKCLCKVCGKWKSNLFILEVKLHNFGEATSQIEL